MNIPFADMKRQDEGPVGDAGPTRRALLAAGGALALGSLAGCSAVEDAVDGASERAIENGTASPAALYAGGDVDVDTTAASDAVYRSGPVDVRFLPPSIRAAGRELTIDGWATTTTTRAQNHNSSRSNRHEPIGWVDFGGGDDADDDDDGDTLLTVLDAERALLVYADAGLEAVAARSGDDATAALESFVEGTTAVREALRDCPSDTCVSVFEHAEKRKGLARDASDAVGAGEWDSATRSLQEARRIVQTDIDDIFDDLDSDGDGLPDGLADLYGYLGGEPTVAERFVVSLPDARLRGGGPALAEALTPARVLGYLLGERGVEGCAESDEGVSLHRDLVCRDLLASTLELGDGVSLGDLSGIDTKDVRRGVVAFPTSGGSVVTGASPSVDVAEPLLRVSETDSAVPGDLESWGEERRSGAADATGTLVVPVAATPPDCPSPMPALLFVRRIRHDGQLLFVGGWHVDDGALYEDAATLLVGEGPNAVAGVTLSDIEEGGVDPESLGGRRKRPGRAKYGDITLKKTYDPTDDFLPADAHPACRDDGERSYWAVQSRKALAEHETGVCRDGGGTDHGWGGNYAALDAPVLHLVEADDAANEVKFKAGAELSKAVN